MTGLEADDLAAAWEAIRDVLPAGWSVKRPTLDPDRRERPWRVVAVDLRSRARRRDYVEATGWTEAEALHDLAGLLRGWNVEPVEPVAD